VRRFKKYGEDYERIEQAIRFLETNALRQPPLADIAAAAGLSEYHFQRLFSRWVGISPKRFLQYLTKEHAKQMLARSDTVLDTAYETGLSGAGRLHDLLVTCEAVTPGDYRRRGADLNIDYGFHPSPFGECLMATTIRGICHMAFVPPTGRETVLKALKRLWPRAVMRHRPRQTAPLLEHVFPFTPTLQSKPLHLHVKGTNFQIQVWEALLRIPLGQAVTYTDIARHIGMPQAARAVGNAVGRNPVSFLIPCHRVIRKTGRFGHYGGGPARKKAMLGWESARALKIRTTG
jgi:AraC family transcriptional regulator of adaptative response/methylated-DNA-[protein]-cysteine methyltransferase